MISVCELNLLSVRLLLHRWRSIPVRGRLLPDNRPDGRRHQRQRSSPRYGGDRGRSGETPHDKIIITLMIVSHYLLYSYCHLFLKKIWTKLNNKSRQYVFNISSEHLNVILKSITGQWWEETSWDWGDEIKKMRVISDQFVALLLAGLSVNKNCLSLISFEMKSEVFFICPAENWIIVVVLCLRMNIQLFQKQLWLDSHMTSKEKVRVKTQVTELPSSSAAPPPPVYMETCAMVVRCYK